MTSGLVELADAVGQPHSGQVITMVSGGTAPADEFKTP
jgi:hypothetical protein